MAYSTAPYQVWKPIEARRGNMCFPSDQSIIHGLPSLQNPQHAPVVQEKGKNGKEQVKFK